MHHWSSAQSLPPSLDGSGTCTASKMILTLLAEEYRNWIQNRPPLSGLSVFRTLKLQPNDPNEKLSILVLFWGNIFKVAE